MKKNELTKLRKSSIEELTKLVAEHKLTATRAFADRKAQKDKELKKVKNLRHDIAQILTIIAEQKLSEKEVAKKKK